MKKSVKNDKQPPLQHMTLTELKDLLLTPLDPRRLLWLVSLQDLRLFSTEQCKLVQSCKLLTANVVVRNEKMCPKAQEI